MAGGPEVLDIDAMITALAAATMTATAIPRSGDDALLSERLINAAVAYGAACQDAFDRSGLWGVVGAPSAANWLAERTRSSRHGHKGRVRDGVAMRLLPSVVETAAAGLVPADSLRSLSEVYLSETSGGVRHLTGTLVGDDGDIVAAALEALVDPMMRASRDDPSLAAKPGSVLRGMALVDLCAQSMRREPSEDSAPDRYRVGVVVAYDAPQPTDPSVPATRPPTASCSTRWAKCSTSDAPPNDGHWPYAGPSPSATVAACSPAVTVNQHGPTSTTANTGNTADTLR